VSPQSEEMERAVQIAVLDSELKGLREQQKEHAKVAAERLDAHARDTTKRLDRIEETLDDLKQYISKNKVIGALGLTAFGTVLGGFFAWVSRHI